MVHNCKAAANVWGLKLDPETIMSSRLKILRCNLCNMTFERFSPQIGPLDPKVAYYGVLRLLNFVA